MSLSMSVLLPGRVKAYGPSPGKETEDGPITKSSEALHKAAQRLSVAAAAGESGRFESTAHLFALEGPVDDACDEHVDFGAR